MSQQPTPQAPPPVPPGTSGAQLVGWAVLALGTIAAIASAFLTWFDVSVATPNIGGLGALLPDTIDATISGFGTVTVSEPGAQELGLSDAMPADFVWLIRGILGAAVAALILTATAASGLGNQRRRRTLRLTVSVLTLTVGLAVGAATAVAAIRVPSELDTAAEGLGTRAVTALGLGGYLAAVGAALIVVGSAVALAVNRRRPGLPDPDSGHQRSQALPAARGPLFGPELRLAPPQVPQPGGPESVAPPQFRGQQAPEWSAPTQAPPIPAPARVNAFAPPVPDTVQVKRPPRPVRIATAAASAAPTTPMGRAYRTVRGTNLGAVDSPTPPV